MPDFQPNDYLFENYNHGETGKDGKELERWEIFAWAVRDSMLKAGGFDKRVYTWAENHAYEIYMNKEKNTTEPPIIQRILNTTSEGENKDI